MALAEGTAARILPGQAHTEPFGHEAAERQCLGGGPIEPFTAGEHLLLGLEHAAKGLVDRQVAGDAGQRTAKAVEQLLVDRRFDIATRTFRIGRLVHAGPATAEPVCLIGLVVLGRRKFLFEMRGELGAQPVGIALFDHAFFFEALRVEFAHLGVLTDFVIHQRLGELGLVALVMPEPAIAPHVDHDVAAEGLAVFDRQLAGEGHCFGIVAVDVEDRCLDALGHIAGVRG